MSEPVGCRRSGDCCRQSPAIRMTVSEAALLIERAGHRELRWQATTPYGFVELQAGPCPFFENDQCSVYDVRPYVCRRYLCFREDGEACDGSEVALQQKLISSREIRRAYALNQRKAQRWANTHGWKGNEA